MDLTGNGYFSSISFRDNFLRAEKDVEQLADSSRARIRVRAANPIKPSNTKIPQIKKKILKIDSQISFLFNGFTSTYDSKSPILQ